MSSYFIIGMFSTLSFNAVLSQMADNLLAGVLSIIGGVISSLAVAWVKRRWRILHMYHDISATFDC